MPPAINLYFVLHRIFSCLGINKLSQFLVLSSFPPPPFCVRVMHTTRGQLSVVLNTFCRNGPLGLLRRFHEKWKDRPQAENVDKLVAVVLALWTYQRVVEHFEGTVPRHFLLPE